MALTILRARPLASSLVLSGISLTLFSTFSTREAHADSNSPRAVFGKGPAFVSLTLETTEQVNHNTKRLRFKLPHADDVTGLSITSAVLTLSWPKGHWLPVARPYTPTSALDAPGVLELLVKQYPNGKQSTHLHALQPGDTLLFAAALRGYQWKANAAPHVTLIAGGAGITPVYQLARGILANPEDRTKVTIVWGVNAEEDVLLREEFEGWRKEFGERFEVVCMVGRAGTGSKWREGRVTRGLLEEVRARRRESGEELVFVCGPPAMEESLVGGKKGTGILEAMGYRKEQIVKF